MLILFIAQSDVKFDAGQCLATGTIAHPVHRAQGRVGALTASNFGPTMGLLADLPPGRLLPIRCKRSKLAKAAKTRLTNRHLMMEG